MLVVLSADMEGVSQLSQAREIVAACPEYWETGKPRYEAEVAAACEGLLAGGATEVVVLDNHASGNPANIAADALPAGGRLENWNVWDLPEHGVDAMFQVGYHARGGVDGFLSHTYGLDLRLRCGDELISESHGRAWAAQTRLIGITGNDLHEQTLGSLSGTPFLVVQRSVGHGAAEPVAGLDAIREFARTCAESAGDVPPVDVPGATRLAASMPNGADVEATMREGGWARAGDGRVRDRARLVAGRPRACRSRDARRYVPAPAGLVERSDEPGASERLRRGQARAARLRDRHLGRDLRARVVQL